MNCELPEKMQNPKQIVKWLQFSKSVTTVKCHVQLLSKEGSSVDKRKEAKEKEKLTKWPKNWNPGTEERSAASTLSTSCGWTPSTTPSPSFLSPLWFLSFPALYLLQYFPSRRKWLPPVCWFIDYSDIQWEFCSFFNGSFFFNESGHFLYKPQKTSLVKWTHFPGHSLSLWSGHLQRP